MSSLIYESEYYGICELGSPYLAHHGVKGQKKGVRQYQYLDGSLTPLGREHYGVGRGHAKSQQFRDNEDAVRSNLRNTYRPVTKKATDLVPVKERGGLTDMESVQCAVLANDVYNKAAQAEPAITKQIVSVVDSIGSKMYGLKNRLKQPTSIAAKIGANSKEKNISFKDAAKSLTDSIRYTVVSEAKDYTKAYESVKAKLESSGYKEERCKNYFESYKRGEVMHKAVQSVFSDPKSGLKFEVQFHTPSSQAAKELKIPIYEERRKSGLSDSRKQELEQQMRDLAEQVDDPKGIKRIKSH